VHRAALAVLVSHAVAGCGGGYPSPEGQEILDEARADDAETAASYCLFGAASRRQFNGCLDHVDGGYA
jgi:hypothetical protein